MTFNKTVLSQRILLFLNLILFQITTVDYRTGRDANSSKGFQNRRLIMSPAPKLFPGKGTREGDFFNHSKPNEKGKLFCKSQGLKLDVLLFFLILQPTTVAELKNTISDSLCSITSLSAALMTSRAISVLKN